MTLPGIRRRALLLGCNSAGLEHCETDAERMHKVLERHGFTVELLTSTKLMKLLHTNESRADQPPSSPVGFAQDFLRNFLAQSQQGDTILVYFSGHSLSKGDVFSLVVGDDQNDTGHLLSINSVADLFKQHSKPAERLLVLDCCDAGIAPQSGFWYGLAGEWLRIWVAARTNETAPELDLTTSGGLFTAHILSALGNEGEASRLVDSDGCLRLDAVDRFVRNQTAIYQSPSGKPPPCPGLHGDTSHNIVLAEGLKPTTLQADHRETDQLLVAYKSNVIEAYNRAWSNGVLANRTPYIDTQKVRLLRELDFPERFLHPEYFRVGRGMSPDEHGDWVLVDRKKLVDSEITLSDSSSFSLYRLVITSDAGIGKTTLMRWLEMQLNLPDNTETLAFYLTASELPAQLDEVLLWLSRRLLHSSENSQLHEDLVAPLLESLRDSGRLILLIDALDQEPADRSSAQVLEQLFKATSWKRCRIIVSGRPHSLQRHWSSLFSKETTGLWQFLKLDEFSPNEQRVYLGTNDRGQNRIDFIPKEAHDILSIPRVLSYLRDLSDTNLTKISTTGDVYWLSIEHLLVAGMQGSEAARQIGLDIREKTPVKVQVRSKFRAMQLLAAIAFEMTSTRISHTDRISNVHSTVPNFDGVPRNRFYRFRESLTQRLGLTDQTKLLLDRDLDGLAALNAFVSQGFFDATVEGLQEIFWRNRSLQEFFTALWLTQFRPENDATDLWEWLYLPANPETEDYYWVWRFVCEMHVDGLDPRCWLRAVEPIFRPGDAAISGTKRSTECIFRAWPRLEKLIDEGEQEAVRLRDSFRREFVDDILSGKRGKEKMDCAQGFCGSFIDVQAGEHKMGSPIHKQGMSPDQKAEWSALLQQEGDPEHRAKQFVNEWGFQPGAHWEDDGPSGVEWYTEIFRDKDIERIEKRKYARDETPLVSLQKVDNFQLSRCPTLNKWFWMFAPGHGEQLAYRENYQIVSPSLDSPAIFVSWYDAWAFTQWAFWDDCSCRLPREYEWEYAAKANTSWDQSYWWGDKFDAEKCTGSGATKGTTPPSALHANPWGFLDILGNVWEWCDDWYCRRYDRNSTSYTQLRVIRGGCWKSYKDSCRTALRYSYRPQSRQIGLGFRVAR